VTARVPAPAIGTVADCVTVDGATATENDERGIEFPLFDTNVCPPGVEPNAASARSTAPAVPCTPEPPSPENAITFGEPASYVKYVLFVVDLECMTNDRVTQPSTVVAGRTGVTVVLLLVFATFKSNWFVAPMPRNTMPPNDSFVD